MAASLARTDGRLPSRLLIGSAFLWFLSHCCCLAYTPEVNHRAIAGLWKLKLTQIKKQLGTMKEFTVYPKNQIQNEPASSSVKEEEDETMLLMLKEDGSFQQYANDDKAEGEVKIPEKLTYHDADDAVLKRHFGRIQGKWDYLDGKLILAADRPVKEAEDTLLVGRVVAISEKSLAENPSTVKEEKDSTETSDTSATKSSAFDTHLSVPQGQVNVGKFFYPKFHPSFFEQPMFEPTPKGNFELKQVLGSLNAQTIEEEEQLVEKFQAKHFYGKCFLLTSHPIGGHRPKGRNRWSIKYNKFVGELVSIRLCLFKNESPTNQTVH
jgi:hypothetical protein